MLLENGAWTLKPDDSQSSWSDEERTVNLQVHVCELTEGHRGTWNRLPRRREQHYVLSVLQTLCGRWSVTLGAGLIERPLWALSPGKRACLSSPGHADYPCP